MLTCMRHETKILTNFFNLNFLKKLLVWNDYCDQSVSNKIKIDLFQFK